MVQQYVDISYTSPAVDYRFQAAGTHRKNVVMSYCACMTYSEERAESGLRLPTETEYLFGDFMARNTPSSQLHVHVFSCIICISKCPLLAVPVY